MLLQRVNFLGRTPHQLYLTLTQSNNLLLVSDGGADNGIGSTGWIIADSIGNRIVKGSSSVPGVDPQSYHVPPLPMPLLRTLESTSTHANLLRQPRPSAQTQLLLHIQASPNQVPFLLRIQCPCPILSPSTGVPHHTQNSTCQRSQGGKNPIP